MKSKIIFLGLVIIGILFFSMSSVYGVEDLTGEEDTEKTDDLPDDDGDGIDDIVEDENKRDIEIWIGESVVEVASIRRSEERKDIIDLRVGYNDYGLSVRVSYGTIIRECKPAVDEEPIDDKEGIDVHLEDGCEEIVEYRIMFEVLFRGLVEFVDLNEDGILNEEYDEIVSDYGFDSFQTIDYSLVGISDDTNLHYLLFNTTDGVFAAHIYLVEEFVYIDEMLISPTEVKIDIEITNYEYISDDSQLALITKLWSEEKYHEREETVDEKEGYAVDEKDVVTHSNQYSGFFSWKETALIDGVEMGVLTRELVHDSEEVQALFICYPRGYHIYHDPKIGIFFETLGTGDFSIIIAAGAISVVGIVSVIGSILRKRRIL